MSARSFRLGCLVVLLAGLVSCNNGGPQIAPVHGRVTLDGRPLENADITFQPDGAQRSSVGRTDSQGHYELAYKRGQMGAIVGPNTVRVEVSKELVKNPPPIPDRYAAKSELHPEVKPGDNVYDIDMISEKK